MALRELIFVYKADAGGFNKAFDFAHKIIKPSSYPCDLCKLTHGALSEYQEWSHFRESVATYLHLKFLYRNQFLSTYRSKWLPDYDFPIILESAKDGLYVFISADELQTLEDTTQLIGLIEHRLEETE